MTKVENKFFNLFFIIILIPLFIRYSDGHTCQIYSNTTNDHKKILNLGFLKHRKYPQVLGAVSLAVQRINNDSNILPNVKLEFQYAELQPSNDHLKSLRKMTEFRDHQDIAAFIGPDENCHQEALVASAWNLPMIAFKCSDSLLSNKTKFPTFARTMQPSNRIAKSIVSVLRHFKWNRVVVLAGENFMYIKNAFQALAVKNNISINHTETLPEYTVEHRNSLKKIIENTKDRTRIYVFIGENVALLELMTQAFGKLDEQGKMNLDEYIIIAVDNSIDDNLQAGVSECNKYIAIPWVKAQRFRFYYSPQTELEWERLHQLYKSVLRIIPGRTEFCNTKMMEEIKYLSTLEPFDKENHLVNNPLMKDIVVPMEAVYIYDAVKLYALAAHDILEHDGDPKNGTKIVETITQLGRYPSDIQGINVTVDENADSEGTSMLLAMVHDDKCVGDSKFMKVGDFVTEMDPEIPELILNSSVEILWKWYNSSSGHRVAPKGYPKCGFDNQYCKLLDSHNVLSDEVITGLVFIIILVVILSWFAFRHYQYEQKLARLLWKVDFKDLLRLPDSMEYNSPYNYQERDLYKSISERMWFEPSTRNNELLEPENSVKKITTVGVYRGSIVVIRAVNKRSIDLNREILKELTMMRDLRHENLVPFIGACVETNNIAILTQLCARGNLNNVLNNTDYPLDNMFIASLIGDLIKGMIYLHESAILYHGNLKPTNCLVDSRWVLQISDFGLRNFKAGEDISNRYCKNSHQLLWKAPEFLREIKFDDNFLTAQQSLNSSNLTTISYSNYRQILDSGSQKGDIYSFAIILYEIMGRHGPWGRGYMTSSETSFILNKLKKPKMYGEVRPPLEIIVCEDYIKKCIAECWREDPTQRPDFRYIRTTLRALQAGLKPNIFDNMVSILEKHASNLEKQVAERTRLLTEEKKKTDALLYSMLPRSVAESLKQGRPVEAENFECVSIYFSDVVDFTALSASSTPMQVVRLLNDLYTCFDAIIEGYDVYKIETIGDAYMVVSWNPSRHASEIASMALHLLQEIKYFIIPHRPGEALKLRIGLHSGPCVAGVVGQKMPRYCLFGDTVNTASRMESSGEPYKIHMSDRTKEILDADGGFTYFERGIIQIKGKGDMKTFWLTGKTIECIKEGQQQQQIAQNINFIEDIELVSQETQTTKNEKFDLIHDIQLQDQHQDKHRQHHRHRLHLPLRRL